MMCSCEWRCICWGSLICLILQLKLQLWFLGAAKMTQERAAQSGAAASSAALALAIRGLTLLLCATLNDRCATWHSGPVIGTHAEVSLSPGLEKLPNFATWHGCRDTPPSSAATQSRRREPQPASSSAEALSALEALAVRGAAEPGQPAPAEEPVGSAGQAAGALGRYGVARDTAWVDSTLQRLAPLLERLLPPLCSHPQPAVREALAKGEPCAYTRSAASHTRETTAGGRKDRDAAPCTR